MRPDRTVMLREREGCIAGDELGTHESSRDWLGSMRFRGGWQEWLPLPKAGTR